MINPSEIFHSYGIKHTGSNKYQAKCPAHDDRTASLTITETPEKILLYCHAGCDPQSIMQSLGYTLGDLFPLNESIKTLYRQKKREEFNQQRFISDYQILTIIESDIKNGKTISDYDLALGKKASDHLSQYDNPDQLFQALKPEYSMDAFLGQMAYARSQFDGYNPYNVDELSDYELWLLKDRGQRLYANRNSLRNKRKEDDTKARPCLTGDTLCNL